MSPLAAQLLYALAWISFGAGHSLLAHLPVRAWMQRRVGAAERLAYNLIALVHIAAVLGLGLWLLGDAPEFARPAWLAWGQGALAAAGTGVLLLALRDYDLGRFGGLTQLHTGAESLDAPAAAEPLVTSGLHRYIRHPLYSGAMALLWGLATSPFGLATAVWASLYFLIGARFEDRKLLRLHGDAYATYRRRVPAFVPWKGRAG